MDGNSTHKTNTVDSNDAYQLITLNFGQINTGAHSLDFIFEKLAGASAVNVLIDDIQLTISGGLGFEEIDFSNGIIISNDMSNEMVHITYNFNEVEQLEMMATDMNGKIISINQFENEITGEKSISTSEWAPGVYQITVRSNKGLMKSSKVIVQ